MTYQIIRTNADEKNPNATLSSTQESSLGFDGLTSRSKKISKNQLINKINYLNFQDQTIVINFRHKKYNSVISLEAWPEPCLGDEIRCKWVNPIAANNKIKAYSYEDILIRISNKNFKMKLTLIKIDELIVIFKVPDIYFPLVYEKNILTPCRNIIVQLIQNSIIFQGELLFFSTTSFKVKIKLKPPQTSHWINPEDSINLVLSNKNETFYTGECRILLEESTGSTIILSLSSQNIQINRFKSKKFRSDRKQLNPSPSIYFTHPLTENFFNLKVIDLSGSGFSVRENSDSSGLMPGLILPKVEMRFANSLHIHFKAQIIYRKIVENDKKHSFIKCGVVFLDIDSQDHLKLISFLQQNDNDHSFVCNKLDLDSLWKFFFESGFIYPNKFLYLNKNKDKIKQTYEKIYSKSPNIARHFTLQDNSTITGHLAMIRLYENAWLIHHHAAKRSASFRAGLIVLNQIGHFSNDSHSLYHSHMNYLLCYFRPENKFPNRVFGGAARSIGDSQKCSIESFLYFHYENINNELNQIGWDWSLANYERRDIEELEEFYSYKSGGLLLKALDFHNGQININGLSEDYTNLGLLRKRHVLSLKKNGSLIAIIMVDISDIGLNLSDLTSGVKIVVLDPDNLPKNVLTNSLSVISSLFQLDNFPVLIYPTDYADNQPIDYEKIYDLWILDTKFGDYYFNYVNRLTRLI